MAFPSSLLLIRVVCVHTVDGKSLKLFTPSSNAKLTNKRTACMETSLITKGVCLISSNGIGACYICN